VTGKERVSARYEDTTFWKYVGRKRWGAGMGREVFKLSFLPRHGLLLHLVHDAADQVHPRAGVS
jgi:hypothetical protein